MCIMDIKTLAEQYNDYIIDRRRYYHTCPHLLSGDGGLVMNGFMSI